MRANCRSRPATARGEQVSGDAAEGEREVRRRTRRTYNHTAQLHAHMHACAYLSKWCAGACWCATHAPQTLEKRSRARCCLPAQLFSYVAAFLLSLDWSSRRVHVKLEFRV